MAIRSIIFVAFLAIAAPATAQQATAQQNLDCAVWASTLGGKAQDETDKAVATIALGWFAGQYEAQTGKQIDEELLYGLMKITDDRYQALSGTCMSRLMSFVQRLDGVGKAVEILNK